MVTNPTPQVTDFTRDVLGRFICNGLDEALRSTDTNLRPDARPFDIIVIGGGTFGSAVAQHLFYRDKTRSHRILVLEGGPLALPEHIQNLPMSGLGVPGPTSIQQLRQDGQFGLDMPREQVWGLPWHSSTPFTGLAYCVGGRSVYWGGWSPQLLDSEMPKDRWSSGVVTALNDRYFRRASEQIGVTETNDFVFGPLHEALRQRLFDGINANKVTDAIPLAQLPLHLDNVPAGQENLFKLEAPLAVQTHTRPGFFPFNKFSTVPLLMKAARSAQAESNNDDVKKRLMVVPRCHVKQLRLSLLGLSPNNVSHVYEVMTNQGSVFLQPGGVVIIALATIESTRLALLALEGFPNYDLIGRNLMAHLRSNMTIRIPRTALPVDANIKELQASALFVKGQHKHSDGTVGHFHLQITAAGLGAMGADSEAELFKKVPDLDGFDVFRIANDTHVVITIRGIGEMEPQNPNSSVTLDPEPDEFGMRRAKVAIAPSAKDLALWDAMDKAADDVAKVFASNQPFEVLGKTRDGLGTTHHEAGTLWMGTDPTKSVTNPFGRFHHVDNLYVVGPALFPTIGSPNPMLTGIALGRRLARELVPDPTPPASSGGFQPLFDGMNMNNWRMAGKGNFIIVDGALESVPGNDIGLLWCTTPTPPDFILKLEWRRHRHEDNSGVFVRFPDPFSKGYNNPAYVGVHFGFEAQIDELGAPDGTGIHRTGAIYGEPSQTLSQQPAKPPGQWNEFEIRVQGQTYTVFLNGAQVAQFQNPHANRGLPSAPNAPSFIGLQTHGGASRVAFRNIRIKAL